MLGATLAFHQANHNRFVHMPLAASLFLARDDQASDWVRSTKTLCHHAWEPQPRWGHDMEWTPHKNWEPCLRMERRPSVTAALTYSLCASLQSHPLGIAESLQFAKYAASRGVVGKGGANCIFNFESSWPWEG